MKCLKHLARDLNISPHKLRTILRAKYGRAPQGRWKWDDKQYLKLKAKMEKSRD